MLLASSRTYVVLSQQLSTRNGPKTKAKPVTLASVATLDEAKDFLTKHVKENLGIVHLNGRSGRCALTKINIKRRRMSP
jgi:hypothetical protein